MLSKNNLDMVKESLKSVLRRKHVKSATKLKKTAEQPHKFNLSAVKEGLESLVQADTTIAKVNKPLSKKHRLLELKRFQQIIKLSEFKSNPLASIKVHLTNSIPLSPDAEMEMDSEKK
jgi:hypothetical protein